MLEVLEVCFAWAFTGVIYMLFPDIEITKTETLVTFIYLYYCGLIAYALLEKAVIKYRRKFQRIIEKRNRSRREAA